MRHRASELRMLCSEHIRGIRANRPELVQEDAMWSGHVLTKMREFVRLKTQYFQIAESRRGAKRRPIDRVFVAPATTGSISGRHGLDRPE
jgi:hypothetical protein